MINRHKKSIRETLGRDPVHPFPARMAPGIALEVISRAKGAIRVLDPMAGSGTVLAMAHSKGHRAVGVDIDPLAVLISKVWTTSLPGSRTLLIAQEVLSKAKKRFKKVSAANAYPSSLDAETRQFITYWFDGYARRQLYSLSIEIDGLRNGKIKDALWCAFSKLIISKSSGASRAMDLSHSRPHRVFDVAPVKPFSKFLFQVEQVVKNCAKPDSTGTAQVFVGDARSLPLKARSIDVVLTSPPYLNAIDYMRCSKFALVWMGRTLSKLRKIRGESVGAEVGLELTEITKESAKAVASLRITKKLSSRQLGILARYAQDMHKSLKEVARVLVEGGKAIYVVGENSLTGVYIRNAQLITSLADDCGLRLVERRVRTLPANRRYLPPPAARKRKKMNARMRREVVLAFERV